MFIGIRMRGARLNTVDIRRTFIQPLHMKIDLGKEIGNALELMAIAHGAALQMCMTEQEAKAIVHRMMQGTYDDLLDVMDEVFPCCFQFKNDPRPHKRKKTPMRSAHSSSTQSPQ
jgi:hypothetical protein